MKLGGCNTILYCDRNITKLIHHIFNPLKKQRSLTNKIELEQAHRDFRMHENEMSKKISFY